MCYNQGMNHYKLIVAYDGTDYAGWQIQPNHPSIEGTMRSSFKRVFGSEPYLLGASRTDAGVHALGQVVWCKTDVPVSADNLCKAWRNALPQAIVIRSLEQVGPDFHPHYNVRQKEYYYHFFTEQPLPFTARYGWFYRYPIDFEKLREALQIFVGTHDFRAFCTGEDHPLGTVRTIDAIELSYCANYNAYRIALRAPKFMRYMIRRLVGAALTVATRPALDCASLRTVLESCNPEHTLPKAPAQGLLLHTIIYENKELP